jgi:hypothetical protein
MSFEQAIMTQIDFLNKQYEENQAKKRALQTDRDWVELQHLRATDLSDYHKQIRDNLISYLYFPDFDLGKPELFSNSANAAKKFAFSSSFAKSSIFSANAAKKFAFSSSFAKSAIFSP